MAVAQTRTATGAGTAANPSVISSVSIGTASSDRVVVLEWTSELASGSPNSVTLDYGSGATAMGAGPLGNFGSVFARIFWLLAPTGTTGTFSVTTGATVLTTNHQYSVYAVTGCQPTPYGFSYSASTDMDATNPVAVTLSIVANGCFLGVGSCGTAGTTLKTWANATKDQEVSVGGNYTHTTAFSTTAGSANRSLTGSNNNEDGVVAWIHFAPTAANFGDILGAAIEEDPAMGSTIVASCSIAVSVGDLIVAVVGEGVTLSLSAVADSLSNSYTAQNAGTDAGNASGRMYYFRVTNAGTLTSVTGTVSGASESAVLVVAAYKGPFTAPPIDQSPANITNDSSPYVTNLTGTLTQADELIVSWIGSQSNGLLNIAVADAPNEVHAQAITLGGNHTCAAYVGAWVVSATTSVSASWTNATGNALGNNVIGIASFFKGSDSQVAVLASNTSLISTATLALGATAVLATSSTLIASATIVRSAAAVLAANSALIVSGSVQNNATAVLAASSTLIATSTVVTSVTIVASSTLIATGRIVTQATATLAGDSTLIVSSDVIRIATAILAGNSSLIADAILISPTFTAILAASTSLISSAIIVTGAANFFMRPDADNIDGGWTNSDDGTVLFSYINEVVPDDNNYIKSSLSPVADIANVGMSNPSPGIGQPFYVRYRYKKVGENTISITFRLKQGVTVIAEWVETNISSSYVTTERILTNPEFAAITDFDDLFFEMEANA